MCGKAITYLQMRTIFKMNMITKENIAPANIPANETKNAPFVNEECGDTLWDPVLKELEDKLANAIGKPVDRSTKTGDTNKE